MGGPIVRSGASPEFSKNWEAIFGAKGHAAAKKKPAPAAKKSAKGATATKKKPPAAKKKSARKK